MTEPLTVDELEREFAIERAAEIVEYLNDETGVRFSDDALRFVRDKMYDALQSHSSQLWLEAADFVLKTTSTDPSGLYRQGVTDTVLQIVEQFRAKAGSTPALPEKP